jgi:hypothetical protein
VRRASARGHRCSPALAEEVDEGEAEPEGCSAEHERQRRGGAMAIEDGGGELLITRVLESGRELESKGERCGGGQGWFSPFIGAGGAPGRGGNNRLNGFNAIDDWDRLRGGLIKGFKVGEGKCLTSIMRRETKAAGMVRGNE